MLKATIWHHPGCSKSRMALERLERESGLELEVVPYLRQPPTAAQLASLYALAGMAPRDGLRLQGTDAQARGLTGADDASVLAAMAADPRLIERPLVQTPKGVRLCRPPERIEEIL